MRKREAVRRLLSVSLILLVPFPTVGQSCPYAVLQQPADAAKQDAAGPCPFGSGPEPREPSAEETTGPNPPIETADSQPAVPEPQPPVRVDPKLVNKKVVVRLRDGQVYKGKLLEIAKEALRLKVKGRLETLQRAEVSSVELQPQQPSKRRKVLLVTAVVVGIGFLIGAIVAAAVTGEGD